MFSMRRDLIMINKLILWYIIIIYLFTIKQKQKNPLDREIKERDICWAKLGSMYNVYVCASELNIEIFPFSNIKYIDIDVSILSIIFLRYWQTKGVFSRFTYSSQRVVCDMWWLETGDWRRGDTNLSTFSQQENLIYVDLCQLESFLSAGPGVWAE